MQSAQSPNADRRAVKFPPHSDFRQEIRTRVDEYFRTRGKSKFGGSKMLVKSAVILTWMLLSYCLLVFWAEHPLTIVLAIFSLSFAIAGVGFAVQHDAGHGAYSKYPWVNRFFATMLDFIGGSSFLWRFKHNFLHHQYTNISGIDADLQNGKFIRLAPQQTRHPYHRLQHGYAWIFYGVLAMKWHLLDDFSNVISEKIGGQKMAKPSKPEIFGLVAGKLVFMTWALVIPALIHGWAVTLLVYFSCAMILGVILATVFQLAHCVQEVDFFPAPQPSKTQSPLPFEWTRHQLATTCDFARNSRFWSWYLGGLNFQIEHHLFPKISHIHYPAIAPLVEEVCRLHQVPYHQIPTVSEAIRSHFRFLRTLGRNCYSHSSEEEQEAQATVSTTLSSSALPRPDSGM